MRLAIVLVSPSALALACSAPAQGPPAPDPQQAALEALEAETGTSWTVRFHPDVHTPAVLEGRTAPLFGDGKPASAAKAALAFLGAHAALFRMGSPGDELALDASDVDELGMIHLRFAQQRQGLSVWKHELGAHFDKDGALLRVDGRYRPLSDLPRATPIAQPDEALASALAAAVPSIAGVPLPATAGTPALLVDAEPGDDTGEARLAYRVEVRVEDPSRPLRREVFVDAADAEPYRMADLLDELTGSGRGVFGEPQRFEVVARKTHYYLEDGTAGSPAQRVYSANQGAHLPGTEVASGRLDAWDAVAEGAGAAVDAQVYLAAATAYFRTVHGRRGALDDGAGMRATVHYGHGVAGAFWTGRQLVLGDGDGMEVAPLAGALDVVAHELGHAVAESSARLDHAGEAGALGEAFADAFACFVEHAVRGPRANWTIGEDVVLGRLRAQGALRDLAHPHRTGAPARLDEAARDPGDRGEIHLNSTIASHAAYLVAEGGDDDVSGVHVDGLGVHATERVFYRALVRYLHPTSGFRDAADATVTAARDLYGAGSREVASVRAAWQAVGVLAR